jgi:hypothetical protein
VADLENLELADLDKEGAIAVSLRLGQSVTLDAKATSAGLLSVGALVSSILLSTAVIVFVAGDVRARRGRP